MSLGNIGEDLQDGHEHEPVEDDHDGDKEMNAVPLNTQGSLEAELEETSNISSNSRSMGAQVSIRTRSR